jgi:glycosyltransferase involved in cell wall biosynthesis
VDALQRLRAEGHDVRLVVAGGGPLLGDVKARVDALGMTAHVELLGELDESTLRSVYAAADVYFAPSEIEGIARTLFEAMAMGVVPVVSDVGGQRELVLPGTGSLVAPQPGTVDDYLPALRQWMDPKARRGASAAARSHLVSAMDTQRTLAALEAAFSAARSRRAEPQTPVEPSLAKEVALLALETTRRHFLRASKR